MFEFFKRNIWWISAILIGMEFCSCVVNGFKFSYVIVVVSFVAFSVLLFFLDVKLINKNRQSDTSTFKFFGILIVSVILIVKSLIDKDARLTFLSLAASSIFITEFTLVRLYDIQGY